MIDERLFSHDVDFSMFVRDGFDSASALNSGFSDGDNMQSKGCLSSGPGCGDRPQPEEHRVPAGTKEAVRRVWRKLTLRRCLSVQSDKPISHPSRAAASRPGLDVPSPSPFSPCGGALSPRANGSCHRSAAVGQQPGHHVAPTELGSRRQHGSINRRLLRS